MTSWAHPLEFARRLFFLDAGCAGGEPGRVDASYVERLRYLVDALPPGAKAILLAFDFTYAEDGRRDLARSAFHTPDRYAFEIARAYPGRFEWAASIHPYRTDCVEALQWADAHGARLVKWLMPLISVARLVDLGLLERSAAEVLLPIRAHNPLLFDFVLKRMLRAGDARLAPSVFHTRDFFLAGARPGAATEMPARGALRR